MTIGTVSPHLSRREVVPINDPKNIAVLQRNEMGNLFTVKKNTAVSVIFCHEGRHIILSSSLLLVLQFSR